MERRSIFTNRKIHRNRWGEDEDFVGEMENALSFGLLLVTIGSAMDLFEDNKKIRRIVKHLTDAWNNKELNPVANKPYYRTTIQKKVKKILLNLTKKHVPKEHYPDFTEF